ncbi:MAG: pyrroloquinoline quinone biosynthesis protein PqqB [Gemmatimonadota bacterium]
MHIKLLGTAAGGGFPQWNCWCPPCRVARTDPALAHPRTQSSAAVSSDGHRWFLLNASPDVRDQLRGLHLPTPAGLRFSPIEGVVTTDAELDHTLGIALLRESRSLGLYLTEAVREVLAEDSRILPVTEAFAQLTVTTLPLEEPRDLAYRDGSKSGLRVTAFAVGGDPPRFARRDLPGHTVGLVIEESTSGRSCIFVPGCGALDDELLARLARAELLLLDGTFWTEDELIGLGISDRRAAQMGHLPVSGSGGSLEKLARLQNRRIYTHINNSNPMLVENSPERRAVEAAGVTVGDDGMLFTI